MTAGDPVAPRARSLAFFDVDNTLLRGASMIYLARVARRLGVVSRRDLWRFGWKALRFRTHGESTDVLELVKARALELLTGVDAAQLHALADEVVTRMQPNLWPETRELLALHVDAGHEVWLVSATPDFLARELAVRLGATGGLGTPLEIVGGRFTGRFAGQTMHGEEKAHAARTLMAEAGALPEQCAAYSDSINDLPLLESVGLPVAVNPDRRLAAVATQRGWRVLRLAPSSIRAEQRRIRRNAG